VSTTGAQAWIADLYDVYVTTTVDVPFFLEELKTTSGPVLELMAGTGRLSLPLAEAGARLTCVDISGLM
jgi:2-polyprenyl-3-methyl-5-hydroxy-6-metoxy-1,4-benzoquinol methylase